MDTFNDLLARHRPVIERYILFRIPNRQDAEDILQEVCTSAFMKFHQLGDPAQFKPWMLAIARNKCADFFRSQPQQALPIDEVPELLLANRSGRTEFPMVEDALEKLKARDREILELFFWEELPQSEIAQRLGVPLGPVKSRLHTAKEHFKQHYPEKGTLMTKLPKILPEYTITPSALPPFDVKWEECMGWMIVPKLGEKCTWGIYDYPDRTRTEYTDIQVVGKAQVHGIEGVEMAAVQHDAENKYNTGSLDNVERRFVVQLTDTHCRYLAESHMENGVRKCYTFLDGEGFLENWGFGEDNCGCETNLSPKGLITREGSTVTSRSQREAMDLVGRYNVTINGRSYDTVCLMDVDSYDQAVATEQYLDRKGRTVLWRRFNRNDWKVQPGSPTWSEKLPENERLTINGETYVHWYDCITDYIL